MIQALKEMDKKRVEELEPNSRKLFDTIMHVCDERDKLLEENKQLKNNWKKLKEWLKSNINIAIKDTSRVLLKSVLVNVEEIEMLKEIK